MRPIPATGRAIALLVIAAGIALAAAVLIGVVWLGLAGRDIARLSAWLAAGMALSLAIGAFLVWVVDRAADGRYWSRLSISGVLVALVLLGTASIPIWRLGADATDRSLLWLIMAFAAAIALLFAMFAAWFDARPVSATARGALDIANGQFRDRLREEGNAEITQLATAVNLLASRAQSSAVRQSNQDRARENLLLAIAADAQVPIDNLRAITESMSASQPLDPAQSRRYAEALFRETKSLQRRIDEVEEMARMESGQVTLRMQPLALPQLVIAVCDRLQPGAATRQVIIGPRVDFSAPRVLADPDQTYRAVEALISYALSETPDRSELSVELYDTGQFVQIVAIERPGEDAPDLAARVQWESAHRHRESALSLAVAGRLIELQGGTFRISHGHPGSPIVVVSLPRS